MRSSGTTASRTVSSARIRTGQPRDLKHRHSCLHAGRHGGNRLSTASDATDGQELLPESEAGRAGSPDLLSIIQPARARQSRTIERKQSGPAAPGSTKTEGTAGAADGAGRGFLRSRRGRGRRSALAATAAFTGAGVGAATFLGRPRFGAALLSSGAGAGGSGATTFLGRPRFAAGLLSAAGAGAGGVGAGAAAAGFATVLTAGAAVAGRRTSAPSFVSTSSSSPASSRRAWRTLAGKAIQPSKWMRILDIMDPCHADQQRETPSHWSDLLGRSGKLGAASGPCQAVPSVFHTRKSQEKPRKILRDRQAET